MSYPDLLAARSDLPEARLDLGADRARWAAAFAAEPPDPRGGARVVPVAALRPEERAVMCGLLQELYDGVTPEQFARDLDEKDWAVVQQDPATGAIVGFSTMMALRAVVDGEPLVALYSGDTVLARQAWAAPTPFGIRAAVRQMLRVAAAVAPVPAYWFMISSTYRSYRLLLQLFRQVAPSPAAPASPFARRAMAELSRLKGFSAYDAERSVVRFPNPTLYRDPDEASGLDSAGDEAARFFRTANPGAAAGARLASLAHLHDDNLAPLARRLLEP